MDKKDKNLSSSPNLARAVGRNTIIQFGGKLVGTVLGFATSVLILRYLHPVGNGAYTTAMAYLGLFSVTADLGLYLILVRDLNKPGADREHIVGNLLALRWLSAALILGIGAALVFVLPLSAAEKIAVLIGTGSFIAVAASQLLVGIFQTNLAMGYVAGGELAGRLVLLGLTWWVVRADGGLNGVMVAVVSGSVVNLLIIWGTVRRFVRVHLRFDWTYWRSTLRQALPISLSIVLNLIYFRADTIILRAFKGPYDVGLYGAAYKILEILNTFPIMFVGLLLPALGMAFAGRDPNAFQRIFQKGFVLLLMAIVPLLVGGWLLAEPLLVLIGQAEYAPAAPVFRLLLIAVGALFLGSLSGHVVTIINRQRQMVWTYLAVAVIGLGLYLTLIPRYSLYGAAFGTIVTEALTATVGYVIILRVMRFRLQLGALPRLILAGAVMGGFIILTRPMNFWLAAIGGSAAYIGILFLTRALSPGIVRDLLSRAPTTVPTLPE